MGHQRRPTSWGPQAKKGADVRADVNCASEREYGLAAAAGACCAETPYRFVVW